MKILYLAPGTGISGGVRVLWTHCLELIKRGHDVVYGTLGGCAGDGRDRIAWLPGRVPIRLYCQNINDMPWDIVVATGYSTWPYVFAGFPNATARWGFVQMKEDLFFTPGSTEHKRASRAFALPGLRIITISRWLKKYLENDCHQESVEVIKNGVDTQIFYPDPDLSLPSTALPIALIVGHQASPVAKNITDAHKAIRKAGNFEIWHVCPHEPNGNERLPVHARFVAPNQDLLRRIYSTANVLVMSSRFEGRSCIPVEAMACKCPVVAMDHKGTEDLKHGRALTVKVGDVSALAQKIRSTMRYRRRTAQRVDKAYKYIRDQLRWPDIAQRLETLYLASLREERS